MSNPNKRVASSPPPNQPSRKHIGGGDASWRTSASRASVTMASLTASSSRPLRALAEHGPRVPRPYARPSSSSRTAKVAPPPPTPDVVPDAVEKIAGISYRMNATYRDLERCRGRLEDGLGTIVGWETDMILLGNVYDGLADTLERIVDADISEFAHACISDEVKALRNRSARFAEMGAASNSFNEVVNTTEQEIAADIRHLKEEEEEVVGLLGEDVGA